MNLFESIIQGREKLEESIDFEYMTKEELCDYIEEKYNSDYEKGTELEHVIEGILGHEINDDGYYGIYTDLDEDDLRQIISIMEGNVESTSVSYTFTQDEISLIRDAIENCSLSGNERISKIANNILSKL